MPTRRRSFLFAGLLILAIMYRLAQTAAPGSPSSQQNFVQRNGINFVFHGKNHYVVGANYWQALYLGRQDSKGGNRDRLKRDLDAMAEMKINNIRIIAGSEGPDSEPYRCKPALMSSPGVYNEDVFEGLDFALDEIAKRGMKAVMVFSNQWQWSGGFAQYVNWAEGSTIPYPPSWPELNETHTWDEFADYGGRFYNNSKCQTWYRDHIKTVVERRNTVNGKVYKEDVAIFSWELGNEPRKAPVEWISSVASYIKSLDRNHMVTVGVEGIEGPDRFVAVHGDTNIDYATVHIWAENFGWYNPLNGTRQHLDEITKRARDRLWELEQYSREKLGKPLVFEEYGLARDAFKGPKYEISTPTTFRDIYYTALLNEVELSINSGKALVGQNFWTYSGIGRPESINTLGYLGDPPHEPPAWYSVFDSDSSTVDIFKAHGERVSKLQSSLQQQQPQQNSGASPRLGPFGGF
ncbi:hypothetical protein HK102_011113 [Quaeritorhiza haematococci]|nr:hypothetical protein HK102_011113 [Quaeritorhiza haematococci]